MGQIEFGSSINVNKLVCGTTCILTPVFIENGTCLASKYAPLSHAHGNINNGGCIGSTSGCVVCTTTSGCLTVFTLPAYTTCVGTVTSVTAGNGMTQSGTASINPTLDIVSHAGSAGSIGTINIGTDAIGVNLGTTNITAAAGNHAHGCITNTGCMSGAVANCVLCTTTSGCITYYTLPAYTTCVGTVTCFCNVTHSTAGTDITSSVANATTTPTLTLCIPTASASARGLLSCTDWSAFNSKTTCIGTITSVTVNAGSGMTGGGTITTSGSIEMNVASHAGAAGSIGTINVGNDAIGVNLGTGSCVAAAGNHAHGCITNTGCMSGAASGCVLCTTTSGCITYYTLPAYSTCTGTVTSVAVNSPLTGSTITTSGTFGIQKATSGQTPRVSALRHIVPTAPAEPA